MPRQDTGAVSRAMGKAARDLTQKTSEIKLHIRCP